MFFETVVPFFSTGIFDKSVQITLNRYVEIEKYGKLCEDCIIYVGY
jgi:hypothetical protein